MLLFSQNLRDNQDEYKKYLKILAHQGLRLIAVDIATAPQLTKWSTP
jgi:hypothetical protein